MKEIWFGNTKIQGKTTAEWAANDETVADGKLVYERLISGKVRLYVGDGGLFSTLTPLGVYTIQNSDGSYIDQVSDDLVLPDLDHTDSNGDPVSWPGMKPFTCTPPDPASIVAGLACGDLNNYLSFAQKRTIIPLIPQRRFPSGQTPFDTEDTFSKETGNEIAFFTLPCNNRFGNTNRFTNSLGGSVYDGSDGSLVDYVLDHLLQCPDGTDNVIGIYRQALGTNITWQDAMNAAETASYLGFTDWYLPSKFYLEFLAYNSASAGNCLFYAPFSFSGVSLLWSAETQLRGTAFAFALQVGDTVSGSAKTTGTSKNYILIRKHTF